MVMRRTLQDKDRYLQQPQGKKEQSAFYKANALPL